MINPSSNRKDEERKVDSLKKARAIWSKMAHRFKEAAHATNVLDQILSKVSLRDPATSATKSARTSEGERFAASTTATAASGTSSRDATSSPASRGGNWSAVNSAAPPKPPSKSYSVEWSYEWLDKLGEPKDQAADDPFGGVLKGGIDWVSFLVLC